MGLTGGAVTPPAGDVPWARAPDYAAAKAIIDERKTAFGCMISPSGRRSACSIPEGD
jgi:hypothetical protein